MTLIFNCLREGLRAHDNVAVGTLVDAIKNGSPLQELKSIAERYGGNLSVSESIEPTTDDNSNQACDPMVED